MLALDTSIPAIFVFFIDLAYGFAYIRRKSLAPLIIAHITTDLIGVLSIFTGLIYSNDYRERSLTPFSLVHYLKKRKTIESLELIMQINNCKKILKQPSRRNPWLRGTKASTPYLKKICQLRL